MKKIGLLTSGGDAPGMNACIAAIASSAETHGLLLRGIFRGFQGLLNADTLPVGAELSGLARRGGSFLGTSRNGHIEEALSKMGATEALKHCDIEGLIVMGGGGSLNAAARLAAAGVPVIGIPCTVDNDVPGTYYSLGFDSAVNKVLRAADDILDTAESLSERVFIIETMGGKTGHMAVAAAYAAGADAVFVHEVEPDIDHTVHRIKSKMDSGGTHGLVIMSENLGTSEIAGKLESGIGRRVRITVLGHTLRGGNPTLLDRTVAREYGETALEMLLSGDIGKMVAHNGCGISSTQLADILGKTRPLDLVKYHAVNQR